MIGHSLSVEQILSELTLDEKCHLLSGKNMWETRNIDRLGIQSLKTTDGPAGVRGAKWTDGSHTTYIPCGISLAATFDPELVDRIGRVLGAEAKSKRSHVLLAPTMNLSRSPFGGRNFENFGEDPFLTGTMATSYIEGVQSQGVGACMKHYVANDMETRRFNIDEQIDERTLRELYLKPFEMALKADPWTAMTAYPKINGEHADTSKFLVTDILREEWGFKGLIMSDWGGLNETVKSIRAGTDLEMPGPPIRYGPALAKAVRSGAVSETHNVDPAVKYLLRTLARSGVLSGLPNGVSTQGKADAEASRRINEAEESMDKEEFRATAREAATSGIVLLKNDGGLLPLEPTTIPRLAIIGPNSKSPTTGGTGSAIVNPYYVTTPYDSIFDAAKSLHPDIEISHDRGIFTYLQPPLMGGIIRTPDNKANGVYVDFYEGVDLSGPVIATTHWQDSMVYLMSDGDTPEALRGKQFCYRARGIFQPTTSGIYQLSLSNTGKAKFFIDDKLILDNTDWTQISGNFMNCGSVEVFAEMHLEKDHSYGFRVDNVVVPPPTRPHDNTLFHRISGVRVGLLLKVDEDQLLRNAVRAAEEADVAILVVGHNNDTEREGSDRTSLSLPGRTDELVSAVCAANPKTTVIIQSACAISMPWAQHANAIVHAWYQGQENGNAIADVLFGKFNPSGKLPITFPRQIEDHGSHKWFPGDAEKDFAEYGEGVLVGYRWFDAMSIEPLFPFGFGLSYTTFALHGVSVSGYISVDGTIQATVSVDVMNTGLRDGSEVVQLYLSSSTEIGQLGRPQVLKSLAGFQKVHVPAGESHVVHISVGSDAVAWFDVAGKGGAGSGGKWRVDAGLYKGFVGTSSRSIAEVVDLIVR
ncbi:hypothetical protein IFR05_010717 [Cadophora sp. M221]|nr:hypothetical protein IFR05_010717 [Cadophora sp. M221]